MRGLGILTLDNYQLNSPNQILVWFNYFCIWEIYKTSFWVPNNLLYLCMFWNHIGYLVFQKLVLNNGIKALWYVYKIFFIRGLKHYHWYENNIYFQREIASPSLFSTYLNPCTTLIDFDQSIFIKCELFLQHMYIVHWPLLFETFN